MTIKQLTKDADYCETMCCVLAPVKGKIHRIRFNPLVLYHLFTIVLHILLYIIKQEERTHENRA